MKKVLGDTPYEEFKKPENIETGINVLDGRSGVEKIVKIDKLSGLLATENTPPELIEEKTFLSPHSILYYINKEKPLNKKPEGMENDFQYKLWEDAIQLWLSKQKISSTTELTLAPTEYDTIHTIENKPGLIITSPKQNQIINVPYLTTKIKTESRRGIKNVKYYINDNLLSINQDYPYNLKKEISFLKNGFYTLTIESCDDALNCISRALNNAGSARGTPPNNDSWFFPSSILFFSHQTFTSSEVSSFFSPKT